MNSTSQAVVPSDGRDNNLKLVRIVLSISVIFAHSYAVAPGGGNLRPEPFERWLGVPLGHLAVNAFFVISGFLITRSYLTRKNLSQYLWARVRRIYPAYISATLFCALVIGPLFTTLPRRAYLCERQTSAYVAHNLPLLFAGILSGPSSERWSGLPAKTVSGLEYTLPGVFVQNPLSSAVNIPIWTLPWELLMYLSVVLVGGLGLWARPRWLAAATGLTAMAFFANDRWPFDHGGEVSHLLQFLSFFYLGALVQLFKHRLPLRYRYGGLALLLLAICYFTPAFKYVLYLSLVYGVFLFAYLPGGGLRYYNRIGDYSFGLYVYCFPIQQGVVAWRPTIGPLPLFCLAVLITLPIAMVSWHCLEQPLINLGRKKKTACTTLAAGSGNGHYT